MQLRSLSTSYLAILKAKYAILMSGWAVFGFRGGGGLTIPYIFPGEGVFFGHELFIARGQVIALKGWVKGC